MSHTIRTINAQGLAEIRAILAANHKLGGDHFTESMIRAWANQAQFQLNEGNEASIEINSWDNISGHSQEFRLSDAAIDTQTIEVDDE